MLSLEAKVENVLCGWVLNFILLTVFQENESVYYISSKDISEGETLKVWYAPYYAQKMNKGLLKPDQTYENRLKDIGKINL